MKIIKLDINYRYLTKYVQYVSKEIIGSIELTLQFSYGIQLTTPALGKWMPLKVRS